MKNVLIMGLILAVPALHAGDLKAPFALPSAKVLPKGVRNLSYKHVMASAENKYNTAGSSVVVADPFFKNITFGDAIKGKLDPKDRGDLKQAMLSAGASESDIFGQTTGQVNIAAVAHVPVLAWGLTSKMTVAVAVPIVESSVNVSTGVIQTNETLHKNVKAALAAKGVSSSVAEFDDKMKTPINAKLEDYNYYALENEHKDKLGDIKLVTKYLSYESDADRIVLTGDVTLPTGKDANVHKVVDVASGDEQTDIGFSVSYDRQFNDTFTFSTEVGYIAQLKDTNPERIPMFDDSKVTPDIDYSTQRDLGDILHSSAALKARYAGFTASTGYSFQYKGADRYTGTQYEEGRYKWLEQDTRQNMHSVVMVAGFDTLDLFRSKKFPVPLSLMLSHSRVISGKNVVNDPLTAIDFSMFF